MAKSTKLDRATNKQRNIAKARIIRLRNVLDELRGAARDQLLDRIAELEREFAAQYSKTPASS